MDGFCDVTGFVKVQIFFMRKQGCYGGSFSPKHPPDIHDFIRIDRFSVANAQKQYESIDAIGSLMNTPCNMKCQGELINIVK